MSDVVEDVAMSVPNSPPSGPAEKATCCPYAIYYGLTKCPYHPKAPQ